MYMNTFLIPYCTARPDRLRPLATTPKLMEARYFFKIKARLCS